MEINFDTFQPIFLIYCFFHLYCSCSIGFEFFRTSCKTVTSMYQFFEAMHNFNLEIQNRNVIPARLKLGLGKTNNRLGVAPLLFGNWDVRL